MLLDPVLHDLRPMPHGTHVAVHAPHQCVPSVTELPPNDELRDRSAAQ